MTEGKIDRNRFLVGTAAKDGKCHLCKKPYREGDRVALTFGSINNIYCLKCASN